MDIEAGKNSSFEDTGLNHSFENTLDTMLEGCIKELQSLLNQNPDLIKLSSPFAHGANLLFSLAANDVENIDRSALIMLLILLSSY